MTKIIAWARGEKEKEGAKKSYGGGEKKSQCRSLTTQSGAGWTIDALFLVCLGSRTFCDTVIAFLLLLLLLFG